MLPKEAHNPGRYQDENEDIPFQEDFCLVPHKCGLLETALAAIPVEPQHFQLFPVHVIPWI